MLNNVPDNETKIINDKISRSSSKIIREYYGENINEKQNEVNNKVTINTNGSSFKFNEKNHRIKAYDISYF